MSFSDHLSSVVRPSVCTLFTFFTSSSEPHGPVLTNLAQSTLGWQGLKNLQIRTTQSSNRRWWGFSSPFQRYDIKIALGKSCLIIWTGFSGERCGPWASGFQFLMILIMLFLTIGPGGVLHKASRDTARVPRFMSSMNTARPLTLIMQNATLMPRQSRARSEVDKLWTSALWAGADEVQLAVMTSRMRSSLDTTQNTILQYS